MFHLWCCDHKRQHVPPRGGIRGASYRIETPLVWSTLQDVSTSSATNHHLFWSPQIHCLTPMGDYNDLQSKCLTN